MTEAQKLIDEVLALDAIYDDPRANPERSDDAQASLALRAATLAKMLNATIAALYSITRELGVPQPGYPQSVANAAEIAFSTLRTLKQWDPA